jgi:hypothetical protein
VLSSKPTGVPVFTRHRPLSLALRTVPVELDLLTANRVLQMDGADSSAVQAKARPPNGNRRIGHGGLEGAAEQYHKCPSLILNA